MEGFKHIYTQNNINSAKKAMRLSVILYSVAAFVFIALCSLFITLYIVLYINVIICFLANVIITVAFAWGSVIFFTVAFPPVKDEVLFFKSLQNAELILMRGEYAGVADCVHDSPLVKRGCVAVAFNTEKGERVLFVPQENNPFEKAAEYDLYYAGERVILYKEAENV